METLMNDAVRRLAGTPQGRNAIAVGGLIVVLMVAWFYLRAFTLSGLFAGAILGAITAAAFGALIGFLFGRIREKAKLGPLELLHYRHDLDELRRRFTPPPANAEDDARNAG
jgi:hypothetical protein